MRHLALLLVLLGFLGPALCVGTPAVAQVRAPAPGSRLDPRLVLSTLPGAEPVAVWVEFADKGERGPADLAGRLAAAERELSPANRRRREKAHVQPLVDYLDLPLEASYVRALQDAGYEVYGQSRWFNRVAARVAGERLRSLAAMPFVRRVAPVELASPREREPAPLPEAELGIESKSPSVPNAIQVQYGQTLGQLSRLNVPAMHDSGYIGTGVNVVLLDDGFNWYGKHEALRLINTGPTRDFIRGGFDVEDTVVNPTSFQHGTATLGALAGRALGRYVGPAYNCNTYLGRTEYDPTEKPIEMVFWSMGDEWADSLGADIISSSLGYNIFPDSLGNDLTYDLLDGHTAIVTRAAEIAAAKGILVVVSGGNDGANPRVGYKVGAPADANGDSVLAIGAVDSLGVRPAFSSKGPTVDGRIKPDLAAQGVAVLLPRANGDPHAYQRANGTSFSAPLVAGLAACLMQARPSWPPVMIIDALKHTASHGANPDTLTGWGIPNGLAALRYVPDTLHAPDLRGPLSLRLAGPNPLRAAGPPVSLRISLGVDATATSYRVRAFDAGGRLVRELASGSLSPGGVRDVVWRGEDAFGRPLMPGLYFLSLEGAGRHESARVVVLR